MTLTKKIFGPRDFAALLLCAPFYGMLALLMVEAALAALTTWLVIKAGQDLANEDFLIADFAWIVVAQSASYAVGAISWIYAERAGFGAFGRYMLRFARENRTDARLFAGSAQREKVEPFLTNETFHIIFELIYELEADLKLFFSLLFNSIVLGFAIDAGLPFVYGGVFVGLMVLQYAVRKWVNTIYAENQRATNSMTARTYTAWDNITSGNRYNFRVWHAGFKKRLRDALHAQIRAIMAKQGLAAASGIASLLIIMAYLAYVAGHNAQNTALLIALAATLPRQIELSYNVHDLAAGWSDIQAIWTRMTGASHAMQAQADEDFNDRIKMSELRLVYSPPNAVGASPTSTALPLDSFAAACAMLPQLQRGLVQVRGSNGAGKSTLLAALKHHIGASAYYWPTSTKLAFDFAAAEAAAKEDEEAEEMADDDLDTDDQATSDETASPANTPKSAGFSSGERQLQSLAEIVHQTQAKVYLLDEWDANLDTTNRAKAQALIDELAARSLVIEISHRA